jgi:hypothetical protein
VCLELELEDHTRRDARGTGDAAELRDVLFHFAVDHRGVAGAAGRGLGRILSGFKEVWIWI